MSHTLSLIDPQAAQFFLDCARHRGGVLFQSDSTWSCALSNNLGATNLETLLDQVLPKLDELDFPALVNQSSGLQQHLPASVRAAVALNPAAENALILDLFGFSIDDRRYACGIRSAPQLQQDGRTRGTAYRRQGEHARSLAIATWVSTFVHDICQPIGVSQNIVDIIMMKLKTGQLELESMQSLSVTLEAASAKTKEMIAKIKQQFVEIDCEPSIVDLWDALNRYIVGTDSPLAFDLVPKVALVEAPVQLEHFNALVDCMVELLTLVDAGIVRVDVREESSNAIIAFDSSVDITIEPLDKAVGSDLLLSALWHSCSAIAKALGGTIDILEESRSCNSSCTRIQVEIPTGDRKRLNRTLKKIW